LGIRIFTEQFLVVLLAQILLTGVFKVKLAGPVFFFLWILMLGWQGLGVVSILIGFLTGLIYDVLVSGTLGWSSLLFCIVGYLNNYFPADKVMERVLAAVVFGAFYTAALTVDASYGLVWQKGEVFKFSVFFGGVSALLAVIYSLFLRYQLWSRKKY